MCNDIGTTCNITWCTCGTAVVFSGRQRWCANRVFRREWWDACIWPVALRGPGVFLEYYISLYYIVLFTVMYLYCRSVGPSLSLIPTVRGEIWLYFAKMQNTDQLLRAPSSVGTHNSTRGDEGSKNWVFLAIRWRLASGARYATPDLTYSWKGRPELCEDKKWDC